MASVVAIADDDDASTDADATSVVRAREITSEPSPRNNDDDDAKVISPPLPLATEWNDRPTRSARERVAVDKNDDDDDDDEIGGDLAHRGRDTGPSKVDDDDDPRGRRQRREATTDGIIEEPLRNDRVVRKTARSTATTRIGDATVVDFRFDFRPENEDVLDDGRSGTTRDDANPAVRSKGTTTMTKRGKRRSRKTKRTGSVVTAEQRRDDDDANANATATSVVGEKEPSLDRSESDDAKKPSSADAKGNDDAFVVSKHVSDDAVEEDNSVMTGKRIAVDESGGDVANGSSKVVDDGRSKKASRPEKTESVRRVTTKTTTTGGQKFRIDSLAKPPTAFANRKIVGSREGSNKSTTKNSRRMTVGHVDSSSSSISTPSAASKRIPFSFRFANDATSSSSSFTSTTTMPNPFSENIYPPYFKLFLPQMNFPPKNIFKILNF